MFRQGKYIILKFLHVTTRDRVAYCPWDLKSSNWYDFWPLKLGSLLKSDFRPLEVFTSLKLCVQVPILNSSHLTPSLFQLLISSTLNFLWGILETSVLPIRRQVDLELGPAAQTICFLEPLGPNLFLSTDSFWTKVQGMYEGTRPF